MRETVSGPASTITGTRSSGISAEGIPREETPIHKVANTKGSMLNITLFKSRSVGSFITNERTCETTSDSGEMRALADLLTLAGIYVNTVIQ